MKKIIILQFIAISALILFIFIAPPYMLMVKFLELTQLPFDFGPIEEKIEAETTGNSTTIINPNFAPKLNESPQFFMDISGNIDSRLRDRFPLQWTVDYTNLNDACNKKPNSPTGMHFPQKITNKFLFKPDAKGNYKERIKLDKYVADKCQWVINSISYHIMNTPMTIPLYFQQQKKIQEPRNKVVNVLFTYNSKKSMYQLFGSDYPYFTRDTLGRIYDRDNYQLIINLKIK